MKKILIVDDNQKILFIAEKQIASVLPDSVVISSTSGGEAIELANKEKPQVILLDILMPGMNGYQACKMLKNELQTEDIPVILISSLEYNEENRVKAIDAGADAFITKPLNKQELTLQLRAMLKIYEGNKQKKNEQQRLEQLVDERTAELTAELKRRKETEAELQQGREKFKKISSLSTDYSYSYKVISPKKMEMEWYFGAFEEITGYSPLKNVDSTVISKIIHPEDLVLLKNRNKRLMSGETVVLEFRIVRKNSEVRWIRDKCEPEWDKDHKKVIRLIGSAQDITERKKASEETQKLLLQLEVIIENIPGSLFIVDEQCMLVRSNNRFKTEFNHLFQNKIEKGDNLLNQLHRDELSEWKHYCSRVKQGENFKVERKREHNNEYVYYEYHFAPVKLTDEGTTHIVILAFDITERKRNEQILIDKEKELQELNATKDKFFSIIAHDLKGPFGSVLGLSNLMSQKSKEGNFKSIGQLSELLVKATTYSYDLLNNLLEWSRAQTGSKKLYPVKQNLYETVADAIQSLKIAAKEKSIEIETDCSETLVVNADPNMLKTIIRNLVSNALKYSYPGSTVRISAVRKDEGVEIAVNDQGKGINDKLKNKLFKVGEDVSTAGTQNEKGTGLGLILCKEFVEMHGGEIWVKSEEKKGTTFYFTLPQ